MNILHYGLLKSQLGTLLAIADEKSLYYLEFCEKQAVAACLQAFQKKHKLKVEKKSSTPIEQIQTELNDYFAGKLTKFKTPLELIGTDFQKLVWKELKKISYGKTKSYLEVAEAIGKPTAFRAVALANSQNPIAIVVPCHRVINHNGKMGGYAGGLHRKAKLLAHEKP